MIKIVTQFATYALVLITTLFLSNIAGSLSYAQEQEPQTDFFLLECDDIKDKVNALLSSKGPVQKNLLDIKNMTFLTNLYSDKCSTGP
jgi:hypothetical protein